MPEDPSDVLGVQERELLARIAAAPRATGSETLAVTRAICAEYLRELGFDVRESRFEFSAFPGRFGTPAIGALVLGLVAAAAHWGARGHRVFPVVALLTGGVVIAAFGSWLARRAVLGWPFMRRAGVNLEASRRGTVRVWLCAHLDSKSQPIPTLARVVGIAVESMGAAATLLLAVGAAAGVDAPYGAWVAAAVVTLLGALPVVLSVVGDRSPGALDNASGVVTALMAARGLNDVEGIGVLLTDAEELGLAGADAWASARAPAIVLNCDGVDDGGEITIMFPSAGAANLGQVIADASGATGIAHRTRRIPLGVLTDSVAFARHGSASVTFSRGSWSSLARVHSSRDDLSRLSGRGIPATARLLAETARRLATATI